LSATVRSLNGERSIIVALVAVWLPTALLQRVRKTRWRIITESLPPLRTLGKAYHGFCAQ
jgi:hypothetical protein